MSKSTSADPITREKESSYNLSPIEQWRKVNGADAPLPAWLRPQGSVVWDHEEARQEKYKLIEEAYGPTPHKLGKDLDVLEHAGDIAAGSLMTVQQGAYNLTGMFLDIFGDDWANRWYNDAEAIGKDLDKLRRRREGQGFIIEHGGNLVEAAASFGPQVVATLGTLAVTKSPTAAFRVGIATAGATSAGGGFGERVEGYYRQLEKLRDEGNKKYDVSDKELLDMARTKAILPSVVGGLTTAAITRYVNVFGSKGLEQVGQAALADTLKKTAISQFPRHFASEFVEEAADELAQQAINTYGVPGIQGGSHPETKLGDAVYSSLYAGLLGGILGGSIGSINHMFQASQAKRKLDGIEEAGAPLTAEEMRGAAEEDIYSELVEGDSEMPAGVADLDEQIQRIKSEAEVGTEEAIPTDDTATSYPATPMAEDYAKAKGVDINSVTPANGKVITPFDVEEAIEKGEVLTAEDAVEVAKEIKVLREVEDVLTSQEVTEEVTEKRARELLAEKEAATTEVMSLAAAETVPDEAADKPSERGWIRGSGAARVRIEDESPELAAALDREAKAIEALKRARFKGQPILVQEPDLPPELQEKLNVLASDNLKEGDAPILSDEEVQQVAAELNRLREVGIGKGVAALEGARRKEKDARADEVSEMGELYGSRKSKVDTVLKNRRDKQKRAEDLAKVEAEIEAQSGKDGQWFGIGKVTVRVITDPKDIETSPAVGVSPDSPNVIFVNPSKLKDLADLSDSVSHEMAHLAKFAALRKAGIDPREELEAIWNEMSYQQQMKVQEVYAGLEGWKGAAEFAALLVEQKQTGKSVIGRFGELGLHVRGLLKLISDFAKGGKIGQRLQGLVDSATSLIEEHAALEAKKQADAEVKAAEAEVKRKAKEAEETEALKQTPEEIAEINRMLDEEQEKAAQEATGQRLTKDERAELKADATTLDKEGNKETTTFEKKVASRVKEELEKYPDIDATDFHDEAERQVYRKIMKLKEEHAKKKGDDAAEVARKAEEERKAIEKFGATKLFQDKQVIKEVLTRANAAKRGGANKLSVDEGISETEENLTDPNSTEAKEARKLSEEMVRKIMGENPELVPEMLKYMERLEDSKGGAPPNKLIAALLEKFGKNFKDSGMDVTDLVGSPTPNDVRQQQVQRKVALSLVKVLRVLQKRRTSGKNIAFKEVSALLIEDLTLPPSIAREAIDPLGQEIPADLLGSPVPREIGVGGGDPRVSAVRERHDRDETYRQAKEQQIAVQEKFEDTLKEGGVDVLINEVYGKKGAGVDALFRVEEKPYAGALLVDHLMEATVKNREQLEAAAPSERASLGQAVRASEARELEVLNKQEELEVKSGRAIQLLRHLGNFGQRVVRKMKLSVKKVIDEGTEEVKEEADAIINVVNEKNASAADSVVNSRKVSRTITGAVDKAKERQATAAAEEQSEAGTGEGTGTGTGTGADVAAAKGKVEAAKAEVAEAKAKAEEAEAAVAKEEKGGLLSKEFTPREAAILKERVDALKEREVLSKTEGATPDEASEIAGKRQASEKRVKAAIEAVKKANLGGWIGHTPMDQTAGEGMSSTAKVAAKEAKAKVAEAEAKVEAAEAEVAKAEAGGKAGPKKEKSFKERALEMLAKRLKKRKAKGVKNATEYFMQQLIASWRLRLKRMALDKGGDIEAVEKMSPKDVLLSALANKEKARAEFDAAVKYVLKKYKGNESEAVGDELNMLAQLPHAAQAFHGALEAQVAGYVKSEGDIRNLIRKHLSEEDVTAKSLYQKLIEGGVDPKDSLEIEIAIRRELSKQTKAAKEREINRIINNSNKDAKAKKKIRSQVEKLIEMSNLGALSNEAAWDAIRESLGMPEFSVKMSKDMDRMAKELDQAEGQIDKNKKAAELLEYMSKQKELHPEDTIIAYYYASILSGIGTQGVNFGSSGVNLMLRTFFATTRYPAYAKEILSAAWRGMSKAGWLEFKAALRADYSGRRSYDPYANADTRINNGSVNASAPNALELLSDKEKKNWFEKFASHAKWVQRFMIGVDLMMYKSGKEMKAEMLAIKMATEKGGKKSKKQILKDVEEIMYIDNERTEKSPTGFPVSLRGFAEAKADDEFIEARKNAKTDKEKEVVEENRRRRVLELIEEQRDAEIEAESTQHGLETTYTQTPKGILGSIALGIERLVGEAEAAGRPMHGVYKVLKTVIVPFTKIVANVVNEKLMYVPGVGMYRTVDNGGTRLHDWKMTKEQKILTYQQQALGAIVMLTAILLDSLDEEDDDFEITAMGPETKARRRELTNSGWKPYTIRVWTPFGYKRINYSELPLGNVLAMLGVVSDQYKYGSGKGWSDKSTAITAMVMEQANAPLSQGFLSSLSSLYRNTINRNAEGIVKWASRVPTGFVPRAFKDVVKMYDPTIGDTDEISGAIINYLGMPAYGPGNRPAINSLGEPMLHPGMERFSLGRSGWVHDKEDRFYDLLKRKGVFIPSVERNVALGDSTMTSTQRYNFIKESGAILRERLRDPSELTDMEAMNKEDLQKHISSEARKARSSVKDRMRREQGD